MSSRPLERLPTIRGKLGATIVVAVAITILISYALIGFALRNSPRDSEAIDALALARRIASGELSEPPAGAMVVRRSLTGEVTVEGENLGVLPPDTPGRVPRWGVIGNNVWASIPTDAGGSLIVLYPSPTRGSLGRLSATLGFLQSVWWQFLLAGAIAAVIALVMARWLARGMTQPLRYMADAARRMETGDYSTHVFTTTRDEVGQLAHAFNRMSQELDNLETSRRDLVANVSHELKTPITVLAGFVETLGDPQIEMSAAQRQRYLGLMAEQAGRMQRLIEDLLTLSALESSAAPEDERPIAMRAFVEALADEARALSAGRHRLNVRIDDEGSLLGSARELHSAFSNMVSNAVRYTPAGGSVTLRWRTQDGRGVFEVQDTGIGVEPRHIPRLTERFYRVDQGRSRETGGTGLGLAIVKHVLTRHEASLEVESQPGQGSTFRAVFPERRAAPQDPARAAA